MRFNPFNESAAGEYFVGRENQIQQFKLSLNGLRQANPGHTYIAGVHGTGKTSYLAKLVEIATQEGFLAVLPTLDPNVLAREHISTIIASIIEGIDRVRGGEPTLKNDWDKGKDSALFRHPRVDGVENNRMRQDFEMLGNVMKDSHVPGVVVCVDEGQRIDPRALSALKNALQFLSSFLIVISLRLISDTSGAVQSGRSMLDTKAQEAEGDFGASRFYVNGLAIGPFETDNEVSDCIVRRLSKNEIQFDKEVIDHIAEITGRTPRDIIRLSHEAYNMAVERQVNIVNLELLNETFRKKYHIELREGLSLANSISEQGRSALRGLLKVGGKANAIAIANYLHPDATELTRSYLINGIQGDLERICGLSSYCIKSNDYFEVPNPIYAYALRLALITV